MPNNRIRVELLGAPRVFDNGAPVSISRKRVRAILYYLVAERAPFARAKLAWMLWPDKDSATANRNLSIHLSYLKNALDEDVVEASPYGVGIASNVDSDVAEFFTFSASGSNDDAIAVHRLFRGDFLEGFALKDAEPFQRWVDSQRIRWNERRNVAAIETAQVLEARGIFDTALALAEEVVERNPTCESYYQHAMRIASKAQLPNTVKKLYGDLRAELRDAYGTSPSLESAQSYRDALGESIALHASERIARRNVFDSVDAPFVGREGQFGAVLSAGTGNLALVMGASGMGKTRMLCEVAKKIQGQRLFISFTRRNSDTPLAALGEALYRAKESQSWASAAHEALCAIEPNDTRNILLFTKGLQHDSNVEESKRASLQDIRDSFVRFFIAMQRKQPVHFFVDNLQHADCHTLALVQSLIARPEMSASKFVATIATEDFGPHAPKMLNELEYAGKLRATTLHALALEDVAALIARYYPALSDATAQQLASLSQGSPLWMKGIIREIDLGHQAFTNSDTAESLLDGSLSLLSQKARDALLLLAAADGPLERRVVSMLCGQGGAKQTLDELASFGFIQDNTGEIVALQNEIIRDAMLRRTRGNADAMALAHLRLARAMEAAYGEEPVGLQDIDICRHYECSTRPDECGIFAVRSADFLASIGDKQGACRHLELAHAHLRGPAQLEASLALHELLENQGRLFEARCVIERAAHDAEEQGIQNGSAARRVREARKKM